MLRLIIVLLVMVPVWTEEVKLDQWLTCLMNDQPMGNMNVRAVELADGQRRTTSDLQIVFNRMLAGQAISFTMQQSSVNEESPEGQLQGFEYTTDENGVRTIARGTVERVDGVATRLVGKVFRQGRMLPFDVEVPAGPQVLGDQAAQFLMMDPALKVGEAISFRAPVLFGPGVQLSTTTATVTKRYPDGRVGYRMVLSAMPGMPMDAVLSPDGQLAAAAMNFGPLAFRFVPAEGPVALGNAELALVGMVQTKGPPPQPAPLQQYRLAPEVLKLVPEDAFQAVAGDLLQVAAESKLLPLADARPLLAEAPQLEIDHPVLRKWVAGLLSNAPESVAERAEFLRLAVRAHLTGSLDRGDATALEAFQEKKGDCTEHANLLTAALRIAGIPARVEVGLVYATTLGGWGGHAWVSAYDQESQRWLHLDAAYPGIPRSLYIRSGSTSNRGLDASLDAGMSLIIGQTIEVLP